MKMMSIRRSTVVVLVALMLSPLTSSNSYRAALASSGAVTGRVYQDFNSNGTYETSVAVGSATDIGVGGITVRAYDPSGTRVGETTSGADGTYSISITGNSGTAVRVEFSIPTTGPMAAMLTSFAGANNGSSVQFVAVGASNVDFGMNVPGEFCQSNPNLSVSRLCAGASAGIGTSASSWITRYDLGPYDTRHTWTSLHDTSFHNWDTTTSATQSQTGSILGMAWDPATRRIFHSAYIRRQALMYEIDGTPRPGAIFVTTPTGTTTAQGVGGTTSFLVDLETLIAGDQFSNSNPAGPGYVPTNAARKIQFMQNTNVDGGVDNDGVDSDLVSGQVGVFEEIGRAGIGDIAHDGRGNLYVVSMYDKNVYKVTVPTSGTPVAMASLGDITSGISCTNGNGRPFSVKHWRGALYLGVVCDGESDFNPSTPAALTNTNLSFTIRKYDLASSAWSNFFGPHPLNSSGRIQKGLPSTGQAYNRPTYTNWNAWTTTYANTQTSLSPANPCNGTCYDLLTHDFETRPQPMLSEIEFDRDGSMILAFRDRNGDIVGTGESEAPDGSSTGNMAMASGDIYRVCRTGTGFASSDYTFEGATGCQPSPTPSYLSDSRHVLNQGVEFYWGDFWHRVDLYTDGTPYGGHGETSSGLTSLAPGFPDLHISAFDPNGTSSMPTTNDLAATFFAGGVRSLLTATGGPSGSPNIGSGVSFYGSGNSKNPPNIRSTGGFWKVNGMSDIEVLCDQAPIQIGNRVWIDTDRDGIQDADETPVPGVTVRLYSSDGATLLGTAITNSAGEYYFASNVTETASGNGDHIGGGVAVGSSFLIRFDNPTDYQSGGPLYGYVLTTKNGTDGATSLDTSVDSNADTVSSYPQITTQLFTSGENDHTFDVGFYNPLIAPPTSTTTPSAAQTPTTSTTVPSAPIRVSVGDYVWFDANRDGVQDSTDIPLAGVTLTITTAEGGVVRDVSGNVVSTTVTDAFGKYSFDNLPAGRYKVTVTAPRGLRPTRSGVGASATDSSTGFALSVNLSVDGQRDSTLDFGFVANSRNTALRMMSHASVGDRVWFDENGDGFQESNPRGVAGATLIIRNTDGTRVRDVLGRWVGPQVTQTDGKFMFSGLPAGRRYVVQITYPKGVRPTTPGRVGRTINSSSGKATSRLLKAGATDLSLDFGVVSHRRDELPTTK